MIRPTHSPSHGDDAHQQRPGPLFGRPLPLALGIYMVVGGSVGFLATALAAAEHLRQAPAEATPSAVMLWALSLLPFVLTGVAGTLLSRGAAAGRYLAMASQALQIASFDGLGVAWTFIAGAHLGVQCATDSAVEFVAGWGTYATVGSSNGPAFVYVNFVACAVLLALLRLKSLQ